MITLTLKYNNTAAGLMSIIFGGYNARFARDNPVPAGNKYPAGTTVYIFDDKTAGAHLQKNTADADILRLALKEGRLTGIDGTAIGRAINNVATNAPHVVGIATAQDAPNTPLNMLIVGSAAIAIAALLIFVK